VWQCDVFNHYGMTEMGLGGGVECEALAGYHIREADLLIEIVDPETGESLHDGEWGEIVFTTLTREGMPLIRYRTGDISRFIPAPCPCGTVLKRLEPVFERMSWKITLYSGDILTIGDLDDALFPLCGILDFTAAVSYEKGKDRLYVTCRMAGPCEDSGGSMRIIEALRTIPAVGAAEDSGNLKVCADIIHCDAPWPHSRGTAKRTIDKMRMNGSF
ncbi:MAG TPA: hypothetical protein PLA74_07685, partial [Syntrophales bacterium]|nr:hypothetical protein [Syntrophales bacterium]